MVLLLKMNVLRWLNAAIFQISNILSIKINIFLPDTGAMKRG